MSADACCERAVVVAERESSNASCETTVTPVAGALLLGGPFCSSTTHAPSTAPAVPGPYSASPSFMTQAVPPKKQPRSERRWEGPWHGEIVYVTLRGAEGQTAAARRAGVGASAACRRA